MSPIIGFDGKEISGVLSGSSFQGEVGAEAACSGLSGDWEVRRERHMVTATWLAQ